MSRGDYWTNPTPTRVGALLALRDKDNRLLLVKKQYLVDEGSDYPWGLVGGSMELPAQRRLQAAVDWAVKETGLRIKPGRLLLVDEVPAKGEHARGLNFVYDVVGYPAEDSEIKLGAGLLEYKFVARSEFEQYLSAHQARRARAVLDAITLGYTLDLYYGYPAHQVPTDVADAA